MLCGLTAVKLRPLQRVRNAAHLVLHSLFRAFYVDVAAHHYVIAITQGSAQTRYQQLSCILYLSKHLCLLSVRIEGYCCTRSHSNDSVELPWAKDRTFAEVSAGATIFTSCRRDSKPHPSKGAAADPSLRPRDHRDSLIFPVRNSTA